ncbi:hypothetical protein Vqi01_25990 [Micromonospora qiuiae]|uniref:DUF2637 domain-containing protein n=1 Tax=Micromonospora qiuiae TaxID=502268 RepID=A0ABQ4JBH2_9ACTN|nr:hypothetical protein [Micromonospora qiuiae]GIJ27437.1 hypothetical protein Vqi01_25990 [Micromonospora qiuiae]
MPKWVQVVVFTSVGVFAYGGIVHLGDLLGVRPGGPNPSTPIWLMWYFALLTVFDPLAALLLALRRIEGLLLGCVVLASDAVANGYANYVLDTAPGVTLGRIGQAFIAALAVALVAAVPRAAPWLHRPGRFRPERSAPAGRQHVGDPRQHSQHPQGGAVVHERGGGSQP